MRLRRQTSSNIPRKNLFVLFFVLPIVVLSVIAVSALPDGSGLAAPAGTGTIIIEKVTTPAGGAGYSFTLAHDTLGAQPGFVLDDGESQTFNGMAYGDYSLTEASYGGGYAVSGVECVDGDGAVVPSTFDHYSLTTTFSLAPDTTVICTSYGVLPPTPVTDLHYGDAPDSYSTLLNSGGPSHFAFSPFFMGALVDPEPDGQPSVLADGDDLDLMFPSQGDDEDGVSLPALLTPGDPAATVSVHGGLLGGWVDA